MNQLSCAPTVLTAYWRREFSAHVRPHSASPPQLWGCDLLLVSAGMCRGATQLSPERQGTRSRHAMRHSQDLLQSDLAQILLVPCDKNRRWECDLRGGRRSMCDGSAIIESDHRW